MDYLSALTYYRKTEAETPVLILNSVAMEEDALEKIRSLDVRRLHLYLDRDEAGRKLLESFREQLPELEILDQSRLYQGHKDFNAFLMARQKAKSGELAR
jgi:5S rRNA maturation endonuclease (ribonuclease M5)